MSAIQASTAAHLRTARVRRRWTIERLSRAAGVSRTLVYLVERGEATSLETYARLAMALGLRIDLALEGGRRDRGPREQDPVHSAIVELLAARHDGSGRIVAADEPFQHYQFAGRADLVVIDPGGPDLLHHEVKTALPNVGELAGSWNVKRRYLPDILAERYCAGRAFRSITNVLTIAWTSECLHILRLRRATFASLGQDGAGVFASWWAGGARRSGIGSTVILLDPVPRPRAVCWVGLTDGLDQRPRHAGYAELARALRDEGLA